MYVYRVQASLKAVCNMKRDKCKCGHEEWEHGRLGCTECGCRAFSYADTGGSDDGAGPKLSYRDPTLRAMEQRLMSCACFENDHTPPTKRKRAVQSKVEKMLAKLQTLPLEQLETLRRAME